MTQIVGVLGQKLVSPAAGISVDQCRGKMFGEDVVRKVMHCASGEWTVLGLKSENFLDLV